MAEYVRLSLRLPADIVDTIRAMADARDTTVTQIIRDAIATEVILQDVKRNQGRFFVEDGDGGHRREIIFR